MLQQQEREMAEAQAAQSAMEHPEHLRDEALILEPAKSEREVFMTSLIIYFVANTGVRRLHI